MGEKERTLTNGFIHSQFWVEILKPHIDRQIEKCSNITNIKSEELELSYAKLIAKRAAYIGLKNTIENEWPNKIDSTEKK